MESIYCVGVQNYSEFRRRRRSFEEIKMKVVYPAVVKWKGSIRYEWNVVIDSKQARNFTGSSRQHLFIPCEEFIMYDRVVFDAYFSSPSHLNMSLGGLRDEGNRKHDWQLGVTVSNRMKTEIEDNKNFRERVSKEAMGVADGGYDAHITLPTGL